MGNRSKEELEKDPESQGIGSALKRAAKRAWDLARQTKTPYYIWRDGQIIDLNPDTQSKK